MSRLDFHHYPPYRYKQSGAAFMVMLVILVLGVATILVASLSTAGLKIERDVKTTAALAQAKEALIGEAAIHDKYPGSLPCPDTDDDGISDAGGSTQCPQYIGRLPWRTLGLPDLRDSTGERLWYTLSSNMRRYDSVRPLNSDTPGTLNITGTYADSNLIAIVFAPGSTIVAQRRSETQTELCATTGTVIPQSRCANNYLEGTNSAPSPGAAPNVNYQSSNSAIEFNDQLIAITHDQIFATVERRVANEIRSILKTYDAAWHGSAPVGAFPYAAVFESPAISTFTGKASPATYSGLLPVGDNVIPTWAGVPSVVFSGSGSGSYDSCELRSGVDSLANARWRCSDISISTGKIITITATLNNVGRGFWRPHHPGNICEVRARDASDNNRLVTDVFDNVSVTGTLHANGSATIVFQAQGRSGYNTIKRIELRDILDYNTDIRTNANTSNCTPAPTSPIIPAWLFDSAAAGNNWHHLAYYGIAEKFAPGGDRSCSPTPCLIVNGQNAGIDIPAVIVMAGRDLTGNRPTGTLTDYFEGQNSIPDTTFENQGRSDNFNDQVITVAP